MNRRKPLSNITNTHLSAKKIIEYSGLDANTHYSQDDSVSFGTEKFEKIDYSPPADEYPGFDHDYNTKYVGYDHNSTVDFTFNSLSLEDTGIDDSIDLLPDKTKTEPIQRKRTPSNVISSRENRSGKPSHPKIQNHKKIHKKDLKSPPKKLNNSAIDPNSLSSSSSELILLRARFESLRTKYETHMVESQEKLVSMERLLKEQQLESEKKLKELDSGYLLKISALEKEKLDLENSYKQIAEDLNHSKLKIQNLEMDAGKISLIQKEKETLSGIIDALKKENFEYLEQNQYLTSEIKILQQENQEQKIKIKSLQRDIHHLQQPAHHNQSINHAMQRNSDSSIYDAQIKALEDALIAERTLSNTKCVSLQQKIEEEFKHALLAREETLKSEMHATWKKRLSQIKESWSNKKRSLIKKVTAAFEDKLSKLTIEWERERNALLSRLYSKPSVKYNQDESLFDSNDDFFSDSFRIDEEHIFENAKSLRKSISSNTHFDLYGRNQESDFKSPLQQKTPHFMSRSRMPLFTTPKTG